MTAWGAPGRYRPLALHEKPIEHLRVRQICVDRSDLAISKDENGCEMFIENDVTPFRGCGLDVPIIFITGADELSQKLAAFEAGAVDFVTKPILPEEVKARVRTHLRIRELQMELEKKNQALSDEIELRLDAEKQPEAKLDQAFLIASHEGGILLDNRRENQPGDFGHPGHHASHHQEA